MLNDDQVLALVLGAVSQLNRELDAGQQIEVSSETPLFGVDAVLDSLQLVSVIVDVESALASALGRPFSLTDDLALSQAASPYRNPGTLSAYVVARLQSGG